VKPGEVIPIVPCGGLNAPEHVCATFGALLWHRPASDPFPNGETERVITSIVLPAEGVES
jgi:hypothetical protein